MQKLQSSAYVAKLTLKNVKSQEQIRRKKVNIFKRQRTNMQIVKEFLRSIRKVQTQKKCAK